MTKSRLPWSAIIDSCLIHDNLSLAGEATEQWLSEPLTDEFASQCRQIYSDMVDAAKLGLWHEFARLVDELETRPDPIP